MKNMAEMLKQAQKMQSNMKTLQAELENIEMEGSAGNGMVKITMTCKHQVRNVEISPDVVDADDIETLEDLIAAAINDVQTKVEEHVNQKVSSVTGGMNIPGM